MSTYKYILAYGGIFTFDNNVDWIKKIDNDIKFFDGLGTYPGQKLDAMIIDRSNGSFRYRSVSRKTFVAGDSSSTKAFRITDSGDKGECFHNIGKIDDVPLSVNTVEQYFLVVALMLVIDSHIETHSR